jgi:putative SOS response-associated peptidase YedK
MCGRYILAQQDEAEKVFGLTHVRWHDARSFNVAPSKDAPVIRNASPRAGEREGVMMRWGLVPPFLKGEPPKYATHNARIETMQASPAFREPWKNGQRCVVPAQGFYEWQMVPDAPRQPWFVGLANGGILPFAGLWERSVRPDHTVVDSFTIITVPANELLATLHPEKRMPAILHAEDIETWLSGTPAQALATLIPYPAEKMRAHKVDARVNSPKNDDERLMEAV